MQTIYFDIETGGLPETELVALLPPFDAAEVKTGNIKDPEKVAAKIAEAEAAHRREFFDRSALDPLTGRVLAVGLFDQGNGFRCLGDGLTEAELLARFWAECADETGVFHRLIGFNVFQFDLPFLVRRSWKWGVRLPSGLRNGRYWHSCILDLRDWWQLGDRQAKGSLDSLARHFGVGKKTGDGKDFAALWSSDRAAAIAYLRNDVCLTARVARAMACD